MQIIQVKNPNAIKDPQLKGLIKDATKGGPLAEVDPEELFAAAQGVHIAVHRAEYRGVALTLPGPVAPQVVFYTKSGSKKGLKTSLLLALVDFLSQNHYTKVQAISSGQRDSAFRRFWKKAGKIKKVASVMEVDLT